MVITASGIARGRVRTTTTINYSEPVEMKKKLLKIIEGFTVLDVILVVGQTRQNLQWMYGKNCDVDSR